MVTMLVLSPLEADTSAERGGKRGLVGVAGGPGSFKVILTLLKKMIAVHRGLPEVEVGEPSFEVLLSRLCLALSWGLNLGLQVGFHELLEQLDGGGRSGTRSGSRGMRGRNGNATTLSGSSLSTLGGLISAGGKRVVTRAAASTRAGPLAG